MIKRRVNSVLHVEQWILTLNMQNPSGNLYKPAEFLVAFYCR